jgi:hypothetical protein
MHVLMGIGLLFLIVAGVFGYGSAQTIFRWLIGSVFVGAGVLILVLNNDRSGFLVFFGYGCFFLAYLVIKGKQKDS